MSTIITRWWDFVDEHLWFDEQNTVVGLCHGERGDVECRWKLGGQLQFVVTGGLCAREGRGEGTKHLGNEKSFVCWCLLLLTHSFRGRFGYFVFSLYLFSNNSSNANPTEAYVLVHIRLRTYYNDDEDEDETTTRERDI